MNCQFSSAEKMRFEISRFRFLPAFSRLSSRTEAHFTRARDLRRVTGE
jgi:hypothetical protein